MDPRAPISQPAVARTPVAGDVAVPGWDMRDAHPRDTVIVSKPRFPSMSMGLVHKTGAWAELWDD